ncbi:uncharacterized protein EDB91DRAFT_600556 [Suillus paluster]|uniref:uncharacterized protein n=1 Tax=Suillus paluster TaxID=48578 RepID=UPI001B86AAB5|nr:uncharacterized protein EDB91DRAFT_600556 [Suillus paluster]KAG1751326.1 hypothetical protein EDB91DRAFT_600556 [Suillus paluster]
MSRHALHFFRSATRASRSVRSSCAAFSRRTMASTAPHAPHGEYGSDTPWMIGSALAFGPVMLYLLSPSARKTDHAHASEHSHSAHRSDASHHAEPQTVPETPALKDDEGTEVSGEEIKKSMEQAFDVDSPKDAQEHEEAVAEGEQTSAESDDAVSQETADSSTSEADLAPSEEETREVAPEGAQPESPATTDAGEASQEAVEEKH